MEDQESQCALGDKVGLPDPIESPSGVCGSVLIEQGACLGVRSPQLHALAPCRVRVIKGILSDTVECTRKVQTWLNFHTVPLAILVMYAGCCRSF